MVEGYCALKRLLFTAGRCTFLPVPRNAVYGILPLRNKELGVWEQRESQQMLLSGALLSLLGVLGS